MIKCIAIDDEPLALRQIETYIKRVPTLELVALCNCAAQAEQVLQAEQVELIFVDVNMPDKSGVDMVREMENPPMVIFTTAYPEYAIEGFRLDAVDYLLKPFSFEEFEHSVEKVLSLVELRRMRDAHSEALSEAVPAPEDKSSDCISIKADYKVTLVRYDDIIYIESVGEYVRLHLTSGQRIMTLLRLKNVETALHSARFMRVHRSYIINLDHIAEISYNRIILSNGANIPIGDLYRENFLEFINKNTLKR